MDFPDMSYSDAIPAPSEIGVRNEGNFSAIADNVTGINFYMDTIAFGEPTGLSKIRGGAFNSAQKPIGIQFFADTGLQCSNGASMHEYIDTVPKGNLLGSKVQSTLKTLGLPGMRGLVPGILEDAQSLNPIPLFQVAAGSGFPACKKINLPTQSGSEEKWVFDRWISADEWQNTPKTEGAARPKSLFAGQFDAQGNAIKECFIGSGSDSISKTQIIAGVLIGLLSVGFLCWNKSR